MDLQLREESWNKLSAEDKRKRLMQFEQACKEQDTALHVAIPPKEYFCGGVYAREITIPAGVALVGEIHLHDQINVVSKGKIRVATEEGVRDIEAPCTFISPAGTKRAGFVLEETVWTVFHATTHTNEADIRKDFIAPDYATLDSKMEQNNVLGSDSSNSKKCNTCTERGTERGEESSTAGSGDC